MFFIKLYLSTYKIGKGLAECHMAFSYEDQKPIVYYFYGIQISIWTFHYFPIKEYGRALYSAGHTLSSRFDSVWLFPAMLV